MNQTAPIIFYLKIYFLLTHNKYFRIPQELGHITRLAVLNLAGNKIPHLPLSFVKLKQINAIWLTENQTKPLVQLNPDTDPYSGEKVLTNFLLPQQVKKILVFRHNIYIHIFKLLIFMVVCTLKCALLY